MYLEFYGFQTNPFHPSRDAAFYYPSRSHRDALAELEQAIARRDGLLLVTGPSGTGKSSLLEELARRLMRGGLTTPIVFTNPLVTFSKLVHTVHDRLFPEQQPAANIEELLAQIKKELASPRTRGWNVAIVIDEAQHLPTDTLAQLGRLLKMTGSNGRVFQIVLVGQPDLPPRFETRRLDHLGELIHSRSIITPLDDQETRSYVDHRVRVAAIPGHDFVFPFSGELVDEISERAEGRPANINRLCHHALVIGARYRERPIRLETGIESLPKRPTAKRFQFGWRRPAIVAALAAAAIVAALWLAPRLRDTHASDQEVLIDVGEPALQSQRSETPDLARPDTPGTEPTSLAAALDSQRSDPLADAAEAIPTDDLSLEARIDSWVTTLNELENEPRAVTWVSEDPAATTTDLPAERDREPAVVASPAQFVDSAGQSDNDPTPARTTVAPASSPDRNTPAESASAQVPSADLATLSIASYPVAEIFVDTRSVGTTPLLDLEIPIGKRFIEAVVDGRRQTRVEVLRRGEHRSLTFRFENDEQR